MRPSTCFTRLTLLLGLSVNALAAHAQTAPAAPQVATPASAAASGVQRQDRIDVRGANSENERRQSTATRIVVNREELLKQGDTTISEALKRVPGVTIGGPPGRGGPIQMRGLGAGFTRILLNGEPLPRGFDLDSLSPDVVERVEVFRAATAEFSSQAVAGAINIVTRVPVSRVVRELVVGGAHENGLFSPNVGLRMSGPSMGSSGMLASVSYTINANFSSNHFRRETRSTEEGKNAAGVTTLLRNNSATNPQQQDMLNLAPRFQWNLGRGEFLALEPFLFSQRNLQTGQERSQSLLGVPAQFASADSRANYGFDSGRSNLQWNKPFGEGGRLEAGVALNANRFAGRFFTDGFDPAKTLLLTRDYDIDVRSKGMSSRGKVTIPTGEAHDLAVGWDLSFQRYTEVRSRKETSFSSAVKPDSLDEDYSGRVKQIAAFAQDEWKVNKTWSLYSGARYEGVSIDTTTSGNPTLNPAYTNNSHVISPSLQSLLKLGDKGRDQLRVALSRTYRAPNPFQLSPRKFVATNNSASSPDRQGNPSLKPELAWGLDIGYEHYPTAGGVMSANLFHRSIDDVFRNITALGADGRWLSQPLNNGKAKTTGIELEAKFNLQQFDKDMPRVDLRSNVAVYRSSVNNIPGPNNRLEQQAPAVVNLGADWNVKGLPLQVGGNLNLTTGGEVRTAVNQTVYSGVKRGLDFYGQWRFSPQTSVRVAWANALHQDSVGITSVFDPSFGSNTQTTVTPTQGILRATLTQRF